MAVHSMKRNDTAPSIQATLAVSGAAFDLTGCTVMFHMRLQGSTALKVEAEATVVSAADGTVRYDWEDGDTDASGAYQCEWEVTTSEGKQITFPNVGYDLVAITDDLA